jgi:spermidine/putrescine transport system permease protein
MIDTIRKSKNLQILGMLGPGAFWLVFFFFIPILLIAAISFYTKGRAGPELPLTLEHYGRVFESEYLTLAWRSIWISFVSTLFTVLIAYPVTIWIVRLPKKWRDAAIFLVMIPFWTNFLLRTYALRFTMLNEGPFMQAINNVLMPLLGWEDPAEILFTQAAVMIGLVYGNLPFMILPLYASLEKFDWTLLEAANDLGANVWKSFARVMLPITLPGLIAGSILVFVPALGNYITVELMGGGKSQMIGRTIAQQFSTSNNWPFGAALSLVMMIIVTAAALLYFRVGRGEIRSAH